MNFKHEKNIKKIPYSEMMTSSLFIEKDILSRKNTNTIQARNLGQYNRRNFENIRRRNAVIGRWRYTSDTTDDEAMDTPKINEINWKRPMSSCEMKDRSYISESIFVSSPNLAAETYEIEPTSKKASQSPYYEQTSLDLSEDVTIYYTHWSDWLPKDVVQSLSRQQFKLQEAIWEFIVTESTFLSNLKIILNIFLPQLNRLKHLDLIDDIHPQNIFGGISEIYRSHIRFWKQCPQRCMKESGREKILLSEKKIIEYFPINFELHFEEYLSHCLFVPKYQDQILNADNNVCFKEYIRWCQEHKYSKHRGLCDFLLEPMQHVMRYTLLLNAIKSHSASKECKIKLGKLAENVEAFLTQINSKLREQEEMEIVKQINNNLERSSCMELYGHEDKFISKYYKFDLLAPMPGLPFCMARILLKYSKLKMRDLSTRLSSSLRTTFLHHGAETNSGFTSVNVYLFTDILLICKDTKRNSISMLKHPIILESVILEKRSQDQFYLISQSEFNMPIEILCFKNAKHQVIDSWLEAIKLASDEFINAKKDFASENYFMRHIVDIKRDNYFATQQYSTDGSPETSKRNSELSETFFTLLDTNREETLFTTNEDFEPKESPANERNSDNAINGEEFTKEIFHDIEKEVNKLCVVKREIQEKRETSEEINTKITRTKFKFKTEEKRWKRKSNSFSLFSCLGGRYKRIKITTD